MMTTLLQSARGRLLLVGTVAVLSGVLRAEAPRVYAITGARVVTASGPVIDSGTIVVRDGVIDAVGPAVTAPSEATVIDGAGLTVYPGLIDMGTQAGIEVPAIAAPKDPRTREEGERWKRQMLLRPGLEASECVKADTADLHKAAVAGITSVLAIPGGGAIAGHSALLDTWLPDDEPQIGNIVRSRAARFVVRTPVLLHVRFPARPPGDGYPESLMGVIALVRQAFVDASYQVEHAGQPGNLREPADPALDRLRPVLARRVPVAFDAQDVTEIRRALAFAREFSLKAVVAGGLEADQVVADLKAAGVPVLLSLNYPERPKSLAPGADEPLRVLRARARAPEVAAALDRAGIPFAFQSGGLRDPAEFLRNATRAVKAGLPRDAAVRALTLGAATLAGAADRVGSIEKGKKANLLVVRGDLFDESVAIRHVFVDGRIVVGESAGGASPGRAAGY